MALNEKYQARTVRQYVLTIKSTIVPDNPLGDDFVNRELAEVIPEINDELSWRLPYGYFAEFSDAGTNKVL